MSGPGVLLLLALLGVGSAARAAPAPAACAAGEAWEAVIRAHGSRYPDMQAQDLYKLLHQGALGSEHAVPNAEAAARWMDEELASMGEGPEEPLVDTIAPGGAHVRVHLRPFMAEGGDPAVLLSAFVQTANAAAGSQGALACALETAEAMAGDGRLSLSREEVTAYFEGRRAEGYPAAHHSGGFVERYRPAYRVVAGALLSAVVESVR